MRRTPAPLALLLAAAPAVAADTAPLRDPMQPPARRAAVAATVQPAASAPLPVVRQILIAGDNRYVVEQGRLRRVGDTFGGLRIERIEDAAVVVRDGTTLRRLPLFAGVAKRTPAPESTPAAPAAPATPGPAAVAAR